MNGSQGVVNEKFTEENQCKYCSKKYRCLKNLKNHEEMHRNQYSCTTCNKLFETMELKDEHEKTKHRDGRKVKKCKKCPDVFATQDTLIFHINEVHKGKSEDSFMCSDCGKQFKTRSELTNHINSKCGTIKLFKCQVCKQELMTAGSLHNHMLRHKGEPNFMCGFCAKLFLTAGQLKVHERIHTNDKAFLCNVCGKGFCHRQSLITHSTLHTGIKPYLCENCGNSFSCVGNLLKHRKTHADCGLTPLTTHRVKNPTTRMKVRVNTPANSRLKHMKKLKDLGNEVKDTNSFAGPTRESNVSPIASEKAFKIEESNEIDISPDKRSNFIDYNNSSDLCLSQINGTPPVNSSVNESRNDLDRSDGVNLCDMNFEGNYSDCDDPKEFLQETTHYTLESLDETVIETKNVDGKSDDLIRAKKKTKRNKMIKITKCEIEQFIKERGIKSKEDIICKICNRSYSNPRWLLRHEKEYHNGINLHCGNELSQENKIDEDASSSFKCSCCKMIFNSKDECKMHQNKEHADLLTCQDCDKIFSNIDSLRTHENTFHKGMSRKVYTYMCNRCGKQFKQKSSLVAHEHNKCESEPLVQCNVCSKQFSSLHVRKSHMRIHDTEKKLLCKFCGKSFHWKGQLKIHERSHTGEKPFTCLYCPKAFAYRESLITHSCMHTGIKPYLCEACGSRFSCVGNLIKHKSTHASTCGVWYSKNKNTID